MSVSYAWTPITKSEKQDDGTLLVFGPAASSALDRDSQRLDSSWLDVAMPKWLSEGGGVREQHDAKRAVGVGVGLSKSDDGAHLLTARIVDPIAVKKIEYGVLKGFSVGIKNPRIEMGKADAPQGLVIGGDVIEVSVCDRPSNPECTFQMAKSDASGDLALIEDAHVVERSESPTYGLPAELYDRLASPVKQALADLAASGAQVIAGVESTAGTEKSEAPDPAIPVVVNVTVSGSLMNNNALADMVRTQAAAYNERDAVSPDALDKAYSAKEKRDALAAGQAMENEKGEPSYTIKTKADLRKAIKAVGRGNADHNKIRAHIIDRAKALGLEAMVPENWNADGSLKDDATKADAATVEKAEALLREVRALVPDLAKADDGDEDESDDIAGAQEAISVIAKLIVSEAESLAMGNLNEACDIALLLDAVRALKWFQANERNEQSGLDDSVMMLADAPVEGEDLLKAEGKNGGKLAPPFKKKGAAEDDTADGDDSDAEEADDGEKPAAKKKAPAKTAEKADAPQDAPDAEPMLTKAEAAEAIKAAVAAALAADAATETAPAETPDTVTKADLEDLVKTAVAQAKAADEERIAALTADLAKAHGDIEAIKAMPIPGGPVLTRTAAQQGEAVKSDAARLLAEADVLMAKADAFPANPDLAQGYRDRARALRAKALA